MNRLFRISGVVILGSVILGSGSWLLTACGNDAYEEFEKPENCDLYSPQDLEGIWRITGNGKKHDCESERANGDLDIEVKPLNVYVRAAANGAEIVNTDNEPDAFYQRIANSGFVLEADPIRNFDFSGSGLTCAVSFSTREYLRDGESMTFSFEGFIQNARVIRGRFKGEGPGSCRAEGTFQVDAE